MSAGLLTLKPTTDSSVLSEKGAEPGSFGPVCASVPTPTPLPRLGASRLMASREVEGWARWVPQLSGVFGLPSHSRFGYLLFIETKKKKATMGEDTHTFLGAFIFCEVGGSGHCESLKWLLWGVGP